MSDKARRFINTSICILVCGLFVMGCGGNPNLIGCPDCGKMVSKKALSCPGCGLAAPGLKAVKLEEDKEKERINQEALPSSNRSAAENAAALDEILRLTNPHPVKPYENWDSATAGFLLQIRRFIGRGFSLCPRSA